ncbi:hypothetical protein KFL_000080260 [Klebsormidium nitens]|uniref:DUF3669 domain-containing protein n=1 Tax=Klebsormidium nitens TaxID=105231 RepID=A0A1Y1HKH5_KLENI|nr:hypothetical protein KFL_000080260 [Klebsormidium nitens]|eukprot:GAQ78122.1 hypothetical protein KFL_000080260 [Klebsormidium nitens]
MSAEEVSIVRVGAGSFATAYVWQSYNSVVLKKVAEPLQNDVLLREYNRLQALYPQVGNELLFKVPKAMEHFPSYSFFPAGFKDNKQSFVARIYLGKDCTEPKRFFNPLNFPLDANRLSQLEVGVPIAEIARDMGRLLSRIHFKAGFDGRDIEFVLGGHQSNPLRKIGFYCFDFNQLRTWKSAQDLVDSFLANDPYYPRPGHEYWDDFRTGYLLEAANGEKDTEIAEEVLSLLVSRLKQ